ncbi:hypothetical protein, partial [uncultured Anoxybacillus sp.]|uniref:hypothetical protein n=1 Tax=uncultured Anoxybacillus sp. TaxID=263860 RepID=UPI002626D244
VAILLYILSITCRVVFIVGLYRENRENEKSEIFIAISFAKKGGIMRKAILFTLISACFYFCLYFVTLRGINHYESLKTFNIISIFPIIFTTVLAFLLGIIIKINFTNDISDRNLLAVILVVGLIVYLAVTSVEYMR